MAHNPFKDNYTRTCRVVLVTLAIYILKIGQKRAILELVEIGKMRTKPALNCPITLKIAFTKWPRSFEGGVRNFYVHVPGGIRSAKVLV